MIKKFCLLLSAVLVVQVMEAVKIINNTPEIVEVHFPNRAESAVSISLIAGLDTDINDFDTFEALLPTGESLGIATGIRRWRTLTFTYCNGDIVLEGKKSNIQEMEIY